MKIQINYVNDRLHKGWYFIWHNQMKLYPTKREAQEALEQLIKGQ